jgi:molecular chaperone GrpE
LKLKTNYPMEEKKDHQEDIIQNLKEEENNESSRDLDENPQPETPAGASGDAAGHKKEKSSRWKGRKDEHTEDLEQEVEKLNDKYLRLYSEFDNYRKRSLKEKIELGKSAAADLITALLPVVDDFERALNSMEASEDKENAVVDGINLIYNKLKNILSQQGVELMKAAGEEFNTDFHEALTNIPAPKPEMKGKVVDVIQNGYLLNGKVIRYAKVVVGS